MPLSTPPSTPSTSSPSSTTNRLPPPITSPKFVTTISNDVRFQVESSNRPNFTQYKPPPLSPPLPPPPPPPSENINELELNSDESRLQFNTSLHDMPPGSVPPNNHNNNNSSITTAAIDDSVSIVPTRPQSTGYRLTTERLAYILIGSCCGLAVLVLIIVAMSVRCKDMCSEYRSWKSAEKAALRWHRHNRRRRGGGLTGASAGLPYPMLSRARFNLPRYFRTSIDNAKLRPPQPPMELYGAGTGGGNSSADPFSDKVLGNILQGEGGEITGSGSVSGAGACCHCIDCSSTFFFRNDKHGGWCCQRGYYQPPRRTKLPFGAASSVNTFMPRFAVDHNGDIKTNHHHHHHLQHMDLASGTGDSAGGGSQEPILGRLQRNASEPNLDMCFNELNDNHSLVGRNGFDGRLREKANSSGAIPVKVNMSSRFFDDAANHPHHHHHHHDHHHQQQSSRFHRSNKGPLFCEIDDDEEEDNDDDGGDVTTDFSNVFETNFDDALGRPPRGKSKTGMTGSHCNNNNNRTGQQQYNQKCSVGPPIKHRSDQTGGDKADHPQRHQHRRHQHNHHSHNHQSHSHNQHQSGQPTEYYNPSTGRYYFDSTSIAKPPLGAVERSAGGAGLNNGMNGESSTIWINSSKLVDKLHRKHQASRRKGGGEGGGGGGGGGHRRGHDHGHHRPTTPEDSSDGAHRRRPTKYHHHQQQQQHRSGPHHQNQPNHHQQRSSASAQFQQQQQQQCHTHFDPGLFARLGLPGKLTGNEHNFVVWNDTSERLI
ncbi:hypothetical protein TYRP_010035 [Tyrophagus putrescentiae]|nr:hypothetical protein TYRP_010035 [Tyrophagus putrescentiae]